MVRVLFVCLGNICRSPMAEAVFRRKVRDAELDDKIEVDSAGTGHWHVGETPHGGARRVLGAHGIQCNHRARQVTVQDRDDFDYIVTMDEENYADVGGLTGGRAAIARFLDFAPHLGTREVPDPYYTGGFEEVYRLLDEAADGLLATIRAEHKL